MTVCPQVLKNNILKKSHRTVIMHSKSTFLRTYFHTICGSKSRAIFRGLRIRKITNSFFMVVNKRVFTEFSELPWFELLSGRCRFPNISKSPRERPLARPQMAKARWRQRLGRQLSRNRWATRPPISARRLAFAILVEGGRPEQVRQTSRIAEYSPRPATINYTLIEIIPYVRDVVKHLRLRFLDPVGLPLHNSPGHFDWI